MKLSEMNTKQLAGVLCALVQPANRIATDSALNGVFERCAEKMKTAAYMTQIEKMGMLLEAVPVLLETHYDDTIKIISIMTGKTCAEVEEQNGMEMINEMMKSIDEQFLRFFKSSAVTDKTETVKAE